MLLAAIVLGILLIGVIHSSGQVEMFQGLTCTLPILSHNSSDLTTRLASLENLLNQYQQEKQQFTVLSQDIAEINY